MANPFPQDVRWSLNPTGPFVAFDSGPLQGRVYRQSGHIELAGPDLAGAAHANVVRFAPPAVQTPNGVVFVGAVVADETVGDGLTLQQSFGGGQVTTRLSFPHDGVLRYEVTDWQGHARTATAV